MVKVSVGRLGLGVGRLVAGVEDANEGEPAGLADYAAGVVGTGGKVSEAGA